MSQIKVEEVKNWDGFINIRKKLGNEWLFRGHSCICNNLKTTLERHCNFFHIPYNDFHRIENHILRDFRRQYNGSDRESMLKDTLNCMALMRHHGAPSRLLDWTYSPYIAAFNALENSEKECEIWCINDHWCTEKSEKIVPELKKREEDKNRTNEYFEPFFIDSNPPRTLVRPINSYNLLPNKRLIIQQGVFLCPGNIKQTFMCNLKALDGWDEEKNIVRIHFKFTEDERNSALLDLYRMNVNRATLYPGIDGFCESLKQKIGVYGSL